MNHAQTSQLTGQETTLGLVCQEDNPELQQQQGKRPAERATDLSVAGKAKMEVTSAFRPQLAFSALDRPVKINSGYAEGAERKETEHTHCGFEDYIRGGAAHS